MEPLRGEDTIILHRAAEITPLTKAVESYLEGKGHSWKELLPNSRAIRVLVNSLRLHLVERLLGRGGQGVRIPEGELLNQLKPAALLLEDAGLVRTSAAYVIQPTLEFGRLFTHEELRAQRPALRL